MKEFDEYQTVYKLGIFYFNKTDRRLLVPKRSQLGWTLNFANPWSYVIAVLFIGGLVLLEYKCLKLA